MTHFYITYFLPITRIHTSAASIYPQINYIKVNFDAQTSLKIFWFSLYDKIKSFLLLVTK